jgi:gephyrin
MAETRLKVALLIVSTTAAKDPSTDASQLALSDVFEKEGGGKWELVDTKIVPDVVTQIQRQIMLWADVADEAVNLIVTTGGTGFATADNTPEVCSFFSYCTHSAYGYRGLSLIVF